MNIFCGGGDGEQLSLMCLLYISFCDPRMPLLTANLTLVRNAPTSLHTTSHPAATLQSFAANAQVPVPRFQWAMLPYCQ